MAINFEQLLKPQAACGHATPRPGQWPKPSAVQWQKPIPGMGHAVDGNWLSALVSRPARRPWAATLSRGKSMGGLRCRVRVFLNRRQRPFCLVKQAVWQCNTGRLAASYGPFSQQAVAQWVGHDGATAVNHAPGPMPASGALCRLRAFGGGIKGETQPQSGHAGTGIYSLYIDNYPPPPAFTCRSIASSHVPP